VRIAFIGLGVMGLPMAANLVRAGKDVVGFNRSPVKADRLVELGGSKATSIREAVSGADAVITVLPDSPDVREVYAAPDGILAHAAKNALLIDMSSIHPHIAVELHGLASERALDMLDAPVSGGQKGAEDGTLSVMVGGSADAFDRAREVLEILGSTIILVGGQGRVQIDDQWVLRVGAMARGMLPGETPRPFTGSGTGRVDRLQHSRRLGGQSRDRPRHGRVRRRPTVDARLGTQHGQVGQTVTAQRETERQISDHLARIMDRQRLTPPGQGGGQQPV